MREFFLIRLHDFWFSSPAATHLKAHDAKHLPSRY